MFFYVFVLLIILQRFVELNIAKRNYMWATSQGGLEFGREHYKWMVLLHTSFFVALVLEYILFQPILPSWWMLPMIVFILAQGLRIWAIQSLGAYWNTRIVIIPGTVLEIRGPYRWIRHPNYLAVILEIATIPLIFGLYITASLFTLLNALVLIQRIRIEEQELLQHTSYIDEMKNTPRLIPRRKR